MGRIVQFLKNRTIGQKLLYCNVGIILIMMMFVGGIGFSISSSMLTTEYEDQSAKLMEQLGYNYNYATSALEDFLTSQTYTQEFSYLLQENPAELGIKRNYEHRKQIEEYAYNLINFNKYITRVLVEDNYGYMYSVDREMVDLSQEEKERILDTEIAYEKWGKLFWKPYNENEVFATKLIFNYVDMKPLAVVSIGVDTAYFTEIYQNIIDGGSGVTVLNGEEEILLSSDETSKELAGIINQNYMDGSRSNGEIFFREEKYIYTVYNAPGNKIQLMNMISETDITADIFRKLLVPLLVVAGMAICLSAFLAVLISGQVSRSIQALLKNIRQIEGGDFSHKIVLDNHDEIGMLAEEFNHMTLKIQELIKTVAEEKVQKKSSQLKALQFEYDSLQAKINPHFLYNTLESISSLAKINHQPKLADSICMLGNYLREAISTKKKFVTLKEEVENSRQYIEIQKLSYGDKIQCSFEIEEALEDAMVPKLILQPLVENAILHGIEPKRGPGRIRICGFCEKCDMILSVLDDGVGIAGKRLEEVMDAGESFHPKHTKVGIYAVHKRIQILYGEAYGIIVESQENIGTCVSIRLPIHFEDEVEEYEI